MNLKQMINRALKANPEVADATPEHGAAIIYTVGDEVFALNIDMSNIRLEAICDHIKKHGAPRNIANRIAF